MNLGFDFDFAKINNTIAIALNPLTSHERHELTDSVNDLQGRQHNTNNRFRAPDEKVLPDQPNASYAPKQAEKEGKM